MNARIAQVAHIAWDKGGEASVARVAGDEIVLRSTVPAPPGARVEGAVAGEPPAKLRVKVHASKKQREGEFLVTGRMIDATRELRERVRGLAGTA